MDEELRKLFEEVMKPETKRGDILDSAADELFEVYITLQDSGFSEVQAFELLRTLISTGGKN